MVPLKRRKLYLDPGSSGCVPKSTKWRLVTSCERLPATAAISSAPQDSPCDDPCSSESSSPEHNYVCSDASSSPEASCDEDYYDDQSQPSPIVPDETATPTTSPQPSDEQGDPQENHSGNTTAGMSHFFDAEDLGELFIEGGTLTRGDAFMLLLDVAIKHGLSWTAIESIQRLLNKLLEKKAFPESKYLFKKFCGLDMNDIVFHFYCTDCMALLVETRTLEERKELKVQCSVCQKEYVGSDLVRGGSFFAFSLTATPRFAKLERSAEVFPSEFRKLCPSSSQCCHSNIKDERNHDDY
ncbi:hypothetical protein HPB49_012248 [Dermacentor silvarum]|uniref:Uncharacterized protein n=1 Tax=Dermacentor silvarum TaxID=543639 RepID=A0ACB8D4T5_DERSI|nr:hypothetical protein HPB49_012248 [Dermacentor silvarum]